MDFLADLIWQKVVGPTINNTFAFVPLWVWVILIGVGLGFLWKKVGWQGLVGGLITGLLFLAYVIGWRQRDSLSHQGVPEDEIQDPIGNIGIPTPKAKPTKPILKKELPKVRYDPDTNKWVTRD